MYVAGTLHSCYNVAGMFCVRWELSFPEINSFALKKL